MVSSFEPQFTRIILSAPQLCGWLFVVGAFFCILMMDIYHKIKQHVSNSFQHHFSFKIFFSVPLYVHRSSLCSSVFDLNIYIYFVTQENKFASIFCMKIEISFIYFMKWRRSLNQTYHLMINVLRIKSHNPYSVFVFVLVLFQFMKFSNHIQCANEPILQALNIQKTFSTQWQFSELIELPYLCVHFSHH